ncbi:MAG: diaminopimelate decarboxylase [Pseudomonadota bacterium]
MNYFHYTNDELHCEEVSVRRICDEVGTPAYIYSRKTLERHFKVFQEPFKAMEHIVCFSVKACSNLAVLNVFSKLGGGADIVSGGELYRALRAGIDPNRIVYSGVGKKASEMDEALGAGILMFNVESEEELELLDARARALNTRAGVALRVNPDVDPKTHPYISTGLKKNKFGVDVKRAIDIYRKARTLQGLDPMGIDCHIGSQLTELSPIVEAIGKLGALMKTLRSEGMDIRYLDVGGGLGISYEREEPPSPADYGAAILEKVKSLDVTLILEPGRVLVGNAGILAARVLFQKAGPERHFIIVDAAMNDLMRPSLYKAHHGVRRVSGPLDEAPARRITADIVGPICESGDFLAQAREMDAVESGDLLALMSAGAYGFSMSSNYNSRPRAPEVLVDGSRYFVIRSRENYEDLVRGESIPVGLL